MNQCMWDIFEIMSNASGRQSQKSLSSNSIISVVVMVDRNKESKIILVYSVG